jgi:hypothetical protein
MMLSLTLIVVLACLILLILVGLVAGLIYIMQSSRHDTVSSAREDWIGAGNEEDEPE